MTHKKTVIFSFLFVTSYSIPFIKLMVWYITATFTATSTACLSFFNPMDESFFHLNFLLLASFIWAFLSKMSQNIIYDKRIFYLKQNKARTMQKEYCFCCQIIRHLHGHIICYYYIPHNYLSTQEIVSFEKPIIKLV